MQKVRSGQIKSTGLMSKALPGDLGESEGEKSHGTSRDRNLSTP